MNMYPCYVKVVDDIESDDVLELPTEEDGTMLLSTIQAQYPNATGLRYKSVGGSWRGISLSGNVLDPPEEGWGENEFFITLSKQDTAKRKTDSSFGMQPVIKRHAAVNDTSDLIVLGLAYTATEDELKKYFEQFGELEMYEIKKDPSGKSKGFGFIRYATVDAVQRVLKLNHNVGGRRCDVRVPKKQEVFGRKLFVGRLKEGTTTDDLKDHFSAYGEIIDVYVPKTFRGFGFVTFESEEAAQSVMDTTHVIKGSCVNITHADPKGTRSDVQATYSTQQQPTYGSYTWQSNFQPGYTMQPYYGYANYSAAQPFVGYTTYSAT